MSKCDEFTIQRCGRKEQCAAQAAALRELEAENERLVLENATLRESCDGNVKREGALRARVAELETLFSASESDASDLAAGLERETRLRLNAEAEVDRLRKDLALAVHTISHQLDNIPKEMRRIAADRIVQFRETLSQDALEGE